MIIFLSGGGDIEKRKTKSRFLCSMRDQRLAVASTLCESSIELRTRASNTIRTLLKILPTHLSSPHKTEMCFGAKKNLHTFWAFSALRG
jgi:hypothetical protein